MLDALVAAPPGKFDWVVAKLGVKAGWLSGPQAAQATRAAELLRLLEEQGRLAELERALRGAPVSRPVSTRRGIRAGIAVLGVALVAAGGFTRWLSMRHPPKMGIKLIWAPTDCPHQKEPRVGYGSCSELRELTWLQSQFNMLRHAHVRGFEDLQLNPKLEPAPDRVRGENWYLNLNSNGERFSVGVGYNRATDGHDGCLRIYKASNPRFRAATACLDASGQWWADDGWLDTYRYVDSTSAPRP